MAQKIIKVDTLRKLNSAVKEAFTDKKICDNRKIVWLQFGNRKARIFNIATSTAERQRKYRKNKIKK